MHYSREISRRAENSLPKPSREKDFRSGKFWVEEQTLKNKKNTHLIPYSL